MTYMKEEFIATGRTVAAAISEAEDHFGMSANKLEIEILAEPKKGFLGFGEAPAKIRAVYEQKPIDLGVAFVKSLILNMGITANITTSDREDGGKIIAVSGEEASVLIGHHGETLDQLQYLVNLAANKKEGDDDEREYTRILVDVEGYRSRREDTLRSLAWRMSNRVLRSGKPVTLEPMSAYERRIIHSEVQKIKGVTTHSIGVENNRRVVISIGDGETEQVEETEE